MNRYIKKDDRSYGELLLENIKLKQALLKYAYHENWSQIPKDILNNPVRDYDCFSLNCNGWEIAERALNE